VFRSRGARYSGTVRRRERHAGVGEKVKLLGTHHGPARKVTLATASRSRRSGTSDEVTARFTFHAADDGRVCEARGRSVAQCSGGAHVDQTVALTHKARDQDRRSAGARRASNRASGRASGHALPDVLRSGGRRRDGNYDDERNTAVRGRGVGRCVRLEHLESPTKVRLARRDRGSAATGFLPRHRRRHAECHFSSARRVVIAEDDRRRTEGAPSGVTR